MGQARQPAGTRLVAAVGAALCAEGLLVLWTWWRCGAALPFRECRPVLAKDIYDFQGLLAGVLAIVAALIAARPVRQQLRKMSIQASVMAREVLANRLSQTERRRKVASEKLGLPSTLYFEFWPHGDEEGPEEEVDPEHAFNAEQRVDELVGLLRAQQQDRQDTIAVDRVREDAISAARALAACLGYIHGPHTADLYDHEGELTPSRKEELRLKANQAERELPKALALVTQRVQELDKAISFEIERLRLRLREIDDMIVESELT